MCNSRYYDAVAVAVSILVGVAFAILSFIGLLVPGLTIPILALALAAFALLLLTLGAASLLRQNTCVDRCIYRRGLLLLIPALLLIAVGVVALVIVPTSAIVTAIFVFLIFTLLALVLFFLYCLLACLISAGNEKE